MLALPRVAALELTYRCNHQCIFCCCPWEADRVAKGDELDTTQWLKIIHELSSRGVQTISFSGGEPSLRPDVLDLIDGVLREGMLPCLISNGRALDRSLLEKLNQRGVSLSLSVPGITSFERQTGYDGVEHVMELFRWARELEMPTTANIAVTKLNLGELYETVAYALVNGASYVLVNRFLPGGRGLDNTRFLLDRNQINKMLLTVDEALTKAGVQGHVGTELPYCIVDNPSALQSLRVSYQCGAAKTFFAVDPSGYVKVCNHSEHRLCTVSEIDRLEVDPYWKAFVNRDYRPDMCNGCPHTDKCDGGCREAAHVMFGGIDEIDPGFVEVDSALTPHLAQ